jgi:branched-chain amino acid transport system permease protein
MDYIIHIAIYCAIFSILGLSLNLIVGYTGLFSITHATFYGIGAYATAILLTRFEANFFVSIIAGIAAAFVVSVLIGIILSRFQEDYYAVVSIGFSVISLAVFLNWQKVTHGPIGIPGINRPSFGGFVFSSNFSFLVLSLLIVSLIFFVCRYIVSSSFGRVLRAIRENEKTIEIFGYKTVYYKLTIFVIGAVMAAIAGSLFASYITFVCPSMFSLHESIFIVVIIILGGLADLRGSVIGALFMILLPEALRFVGMPTGIAAQARQVIYGVALIVLMLYRPQGLTGEYKI